MDWLLPSIQPAKVFHLADRILEGKAFLSSPTGTQATVDFLVTEDPDKTTKQ